MNPNFLFGYCQYVSAKNWLDLADVTLLIQMTNLEAVVAF
jgi:hypothetical protein